MGRCEAGGALDMGRCEAGCEVESGLTLGLFVSGKRMLMTSARLSVALCTPECSLFTS
jgi:hypothetical protein